MKNVLPQSRKRVFILICLILLLVLPSYIGADGESQCVACHTSGRSLIKATREIADELGDEIMKSTESEGEG